LKSLICQLIRKYAKTKLITKTRRRVMVWSTPISEPVGTIAGIAAGELSSLCSQKVARALNIDRQSAEFLTTTVGHFAASVTSKVVVNAMCADPIGLGISPTTAALTAVTHGATRAYVLPPIKRALRGYPQDPVLKPSYS
jgi:hypothetical protein